MNTKKKSAIVENVMNVILFFSLLSAILYAICCYLGNKENVDSCIKQVKNELNTFAVSAKSEISTIGTDYYNIAQNISGLGEDDRVLYALSSGETWFLNERELDLYMVVYKFSVDHTYSEEFNIIKDAHDLVCKSASYGNHLIGHIEANDDSQHSYGALCLKEGAVCAAYARAMVLLCRSAGIEATYVSGYVGESGHAWVIVRLENLYYHVDPCWDDTNNELNYDYFLLSDSEMEKNRIWEEWSYPSCPQSYNFTVHN